MNIEDLEKMKRHLGKGGDVEIVNVDGEKDTFHLEQLGVGSLPSLLMVYGELEEAGTFNNMSMDGKNRLIDLVVESVNGSYTKPKTMPQEEYDALTGKFVTLNFIPLMMKVFDLNGMGSRSMKDSDVDKVKAVQERVANAKRENAVGKPQDSEKGDNK